MSELLNQAEIDALMSAHKAVRADQTEEHLRHKNVRLYDFSRPDKLSKEHIRLLNQVYEKHGSDLGSVLSPMLRSDTQVSLLSLEQFTYREYCASVPERTLCVEASIEPLSSAAVFEFNPVFASACIDILTGASTVSTDVSSDFTNMEKAIIRRVVDIALEKYAEVWAGVVTIEPRVIALTSGLTEGDTWVASEPVLVAGYEVSVAEQTSMMSICVPSTAIESVLPALVLGNRPNASNRRPDRAHEALRKPFGQIGVQCHAILGRTSLSLGEIAGLQVGDLIQLPARPNDEGELWIENVAGFAGIFGRSGDRLAMKISKPLSDFDPEQLLGGAGSP